MFLTPDITDEAWRQKRRLTSRTAPHLKQWLVDKLLTALNHQLLNVLDVTVPARPGVRHGGARHSHLLIQSLLCDRILQIKISRHVTIFAFTLEEGKYLAQGKNIRQQRTKAFTMIHNAYMYIYIVVYIMYIDKSCTGFAWTLGRQRSLLRVTMCIYSW